MVNSRGDAANLLPLGRDGSNRIGPGRSAHRSAAPDLDDVSLSIGPGPVPGIPIAPGDSAVAVGLGDESTAVAKAVTPGVRSLAIATGWGGDCDWPAGGSDRSAGRHLAAAAGLDGVAVAGPAGRRAMVAGGLAPSSVQTLPPLPPIIQRINKSDARRTLAAVNTDLQTDAGDPVLLWSGPMPMAGPAAPTRPGDAGDWGPGVHRMVAAARGLIAARPNLRIWLHGDGRARDWIHSELKAEGVRRSVAIPGTFDHLDELLSAADLAILTDDVQWRHFGPAAVIAGVPLLVPEGAVARDAMAGWQLPAGEVRWYDPRTRRRLHDAIVEMIDDVLAQSNTCGQASAIGDSVVLRRTLGRWVDWIGGGEPT